MYKQRYAWTVTAALFLAAGVASYGFRSEEPAQGKAAVAAAADAKAPAAPAMAARMLVADVMHDVGVEWDAERGVPSLVTGTNLAAGGRAPGGTPGLQAAGPADLARASVAVMDGLAKVYGIRDASSELKPLAVESSASGYRHVRLRQEYFGLPVIGAQLIVHYDNQGVARSVNGIYRPDLGVPTKPALSAEQALAVARQDLQGMGKPQGAASVPELVVWARRGTPALAYQLVLTYATDGGLAGRWRYWIDARTGAVLTRYNDVPSIAAPTAAGAHVPIMGAVLEGEGGGVATVTGWRENSGPYYYLWNKSNTWYIYNSGIGPDGRTYAYRTTDDWGTSDRVEMSAASGFDAVEMYYRDVHGRLSFNDANAMARVNVHYGYDYVDAFWNGTDFTFGDGDGYYANALAVLDIAGHEFQHAVTEYSANLVYQDESGQLNESFSDIFGALVEFRAQPDGREAYPNRVPGAADWLLGEDCWLVSTALRDMRNPANPLTVGEGNEQPTRYKGKYWYSGGGDNGGVHYNCSVQNFFFYLLCEGGSGTNDGIPYAVFPVGIPVAEKLAYLALTRYMGPDTDHTAARAAWLAAAGELDGAGQATNSLLSVMQAWAAVGLGKAEIIMPTEPFVVSGETNAPPYLPSNRTYMVVNTTAGAMNWTVSCAKPWLTVYPAALTVEPGAYATVQAAIVQAEAASLPEGVYGDAITFETTLGGQSTNFLRAVALRIGRNYRMQSVPFAWVDPRAAPGYSVLDLSAGVSGAYPIPFVFRLYGARYDHVYVSPFGLAGFVNGALNTSENADLPTTQAPKAFVAPYWDNLESRRVPAAVIAGVMGVAPDRQLVLSWLDTMHSSDLTARFTFQVVVSETAVDGDNNDILFQYKEVSEHNAAVGCGRSATIGIEDELGALNKKYSFDGSTWVANEQAILFTQTPRVSASTPAGSVKALGAVGSTVSFEIRFSEAVTGLEVGDLVLGGTAGGVIGGLSGGGMLYEVAVSDVIGYGSVTLGVVSNAVQNERGAVNAAFGPGIYVMPCAAVNAVDDMEVGPGRWVVSRQEPLQLVTTGWQWGTPSYVGGPENTPSGTKCWGTFMDGVYSNNMNAWVESAPIAVGANPVVELSAWYDLEAILDIYFYDFGYVEANNGSAWFNVTPGGALGGFSGGWLRQQILLDDALFGNRTIKLRFRMTSDGSVVRAGMYVDDLKVSSQAAPGVWVIGYGATNGAAGGTVPMRFTIYNSSTQTITGIKGTVSSPNAGVSFAGSPAVTYGDMAPGAVVTGAPVAMVLGAAGNFGSDTVQLFHSLTADGGFSAQEVLPFTVVGAAPLSSTNVITVKATVGVTNWVGKALKGDGTPASCLFQAIGAGSNGVIDPPAVGGAVSGDDVLLFSSAGGYPFGRFGEGVGVSADFGRFSKSFVHALPTGTPVYVRAWDAATPETSVAYGDSGVYALRGGSGETNDFRGWAAATPWMPARDSNGDSIPDGYCVLNGLDPRSPILPLSPGWNSLGALNGANTASGKFGVPAPTRVVVRGAILFALDTGNNRVQVWNRETMAYGGSYGSGGSASGAFSQPFGLALDPRAGTNRFAVADTQNHRVQVFGFDPLSGTNIAFQFQFGSMGGGSGQFRNPNGVAFGPDGKIFVADTGNGVDAGNSRIQMFSDAGTYLATIATSGTNAGQVHMPRGLCVSEEGVVVVADTGNSRIQAFDQAGSNLWSVGSLGTNALQFWEPRGVQTGVGGRLYVADSGNSRLQVLTPGGAWLGTLGPRDFTGNQVLNRPYDVAPALDSGVAYVADTFNGRVRAISVVLDGDADGMNDLWEAVYGLDPTVNDALVDSNGDGVLNIGEYRTGQNPAEGGLIQALRITQFKVSPPVLKWETVSTGGVYRIEYSCDSSRMASNSWNSSAVVTSQVAGALAVTNALTVTNRVQYFRVIKIGP